METPERQPKAASPLRTIAITAIVTLALSAAAYRYVGPVLPSVQQHLAAPSVSGEAQAEETLYVSPMHPWIVSEEPGQCPICGMDLVPMRDAGRRPARLRANAPSPTGARP